jgi:hypothetical protein
MHYSRNMNKKLAVLILLVLLAGGLQAENIRVIVPYLGAATNVYDNPARSLHSEDTKLMEGLFFQWVNPDLFQANAFVYHSADINYSQLWGGHLIGDFYVWSNRLGKAAVGAGVEVISLDMDAGAAFPPLADFKFPLKLYIPYARAGHYFYLGSRDKVLLSIFPWAGAEYDIARGTITLVPPGPPIPQTENQDDETLYGIAGLSLGATIFHFIELQAKYKVNFNADDVLHTVDGLANLYFSRHWGLSYRFKYMQTKSGSANGSTTYHLLGIAFVF